MVGDAMAGQGTEIGSGDVLPSIPKCCLCQLVYKRMSEPFSCDTDAAHLVARQLVVCPKLSFFLPD